MLQCHLCDVTFVNNAGGQLTNHLESVHSSSLADYVIATQLHGVEPRCVCGLCNERPKFLRGSFKKYAADHCRFDVRERLYRAKHGDPVCVQCGCAVKFSRGKPQEHCSLRCAMVGKGFANPEVQKRITEVVKERYGVDNVSQLDEVRQKISVAKTGHSCGPLSVEHKQLIRDASRNRWSDPDYKARTSASIKRAVNSPEEKLRRSKKMTAQMNDPVFLDIMWSHHKNRLTKLHQRLRVALKLNELGFIPEQRIGNRWVDDLNEKAKVIVEINGDYTHANPKLFGPTDVIRLQGQSFTAAEKWNLDAIRRHELESYGYKIIVVWESDDLDVIRLQLSEILTTQRHTR